MFVVKYLDKKIQKFSRICLKYYFDDDFVVVAKRPI